MSKQEFLSKLQELIADYPTDEAKKSLEYYSEIIEDRMEDGMTEGEAVASLGNVESIAEQIKCEIPIVALVKNKAKQKTSGKKLPVWAIVIIVLGSPVWGSFAITLISVFLSLYASVWCFDLSFWIVTLCTAFVAPIMIICAIVNLVNGAILSALLNLGGMFLFSGLAILFGILSFLISKGIVAGSKWLFLQFKKLL